MLKAKVYPLVCDAIEVGIDRGYRRAYKHIDNPDEDQIKSAIYEAVLQEMFERFYIDEETQV
jgi:hypothetical protein